MPRLVAQSSEFSGQIFDLTGPEITLGRLEDNQVTIAHTSISGHHAVMKLDNQDYIIQDLQSTNGTRVNGERVTEHKLRRNDLLRVGNIELLYDSEHAPPGRAMPKLAPRVNLSECNSSGRPQNFVNSSPVQKKKKSRIDPWWTIGFALGAIAAIAAIGYFVLTVFLHGAEGGS